MQLSRYFAMSSLLGYPSLPCVGGGRILGPPLFTRIDFAPRDLLAFNQLLATATPALRFSASCSARSRGALLEMCWHLVLVVTILFAILSSQRFPASVDGSNSRTVRVWSPTGTDTCVYILSSVTSPKRPEKRSMVVTPGNVFFVNSGKSSIVISPYFFFISAET